MPDEPLTLEQAIAPFFWEDLPEGALAVIEEHAVAIATELESYAAWARGNCDLASTAWLAAFVAARLPATKVHGYYWPEASPDVSPPGLSDHTWLELGGGLFDPAAGQFAGPISRAHYHRDGMPIA